MIEFLFKNYKGQIISIDLLIGIVIFLIVVIFSVSYWQTSLFNVRESLDRIDVQRLATQISDNLVKSPGIPDNWETSPTNARAIGLANHSHILETRKVANLTALNYSTLLTRFGLEGANFFFQLTDQAKNNITSAGLLLTSNATQAAVVERNVIYNQRPAYLTFIVWRN